jgi:peptidoglycan endopeptidase LytF
MKKKANPSGRFKVSRGETLYDIARRFRVSVSALREANDMSPRSILKAGQTLKIPGNADWDSGSQQAAEGNSAKPESTVGGVHRVTRGESIYTIANRYGISQETLMEANGLTSSGIKAGQSLTIPGTLPSTSGSGTVTATSTPSAVKAAAPSQASRLPSGKTHRVEKGESIYSIALAYGISQDELLAVNGLARSNIQAGQELALPQNSNSTSSSSPSATSSANPASGKTSPSSDRQTARNHAVKSGESFYSIAQDYGTDIGSLLALNQKQANSVLYPGENLRIPASEAPGKGGKNSPASSESTQQFYQVKPGDTLWDISVRFKASIAEIKALNEGLTSALRPGQSIRVR